MGRRTILFVDDEERILSGFRRSFYDKKDEWEMEFSNSGEEALNALSKRKYDVIISDMRMPHMDGAELLQKVQNLYPDVIRIILSGQTEQELAMRTVHVAHQFLSKPCDSKYLAQIIERTLSIQDTLQNQSIKDIVGEIGQLPSLPKAYQELINNISKPNISIKDISTIIENDLAVSAKVIQLVNSAFFALPRRITDISQAVQYIGLTTLKSLTLSAGIFHSFENKSFSSRRLLEELQVHSVLCANIAKNMLTDKNMAEDAFLAGMLHDIGKLILIAYLPNEYAKISNRARETGDEFHVVEKEILGVTHAEIGAYLLAIWGLPSSIVEAVAYHHDPTRVQHTEFSVLDAIYITNCLVQKEESERTVDMNYLKSLGVQDHLLKWQKMVCSKLQINS